MSGEMKLSREAYDRLDRVNWSKLKLMPVPAKYRHRVVAGEGEDTAARARGRVTHLAVLEPERYRTEVAVWTEGDRRGKAWEAFRAAHAGLEIIKQDQHEEVMALSAAVRSSAQAAPFLTGGRSEVSLLWRHVEPELGAVPGFEVDCKGRLDFVTPACITDLKVTRDASPSGFGRQCAQYQYHVQAAWYVDAYKAVHGVELPYVLVAVESAAPHVVQVYRLNEDLLDLGREVYRDLLGRLRLCRSTNSWPGYAEAPMDLTLPAWAAPANDDDSVEGLDLVINS